MTDQAKRRRSKRLFAPQIPDGAEEKLYPVGIVELILAICQYWHESPGRSKMSINEFSSRQDFVNTYKLITGEIYRGHKDEFVVDPTKGLHKLVYPLTKGEVDADFYKLRLFAEHIGLPTGIFLLLTQLVSDERRALEESQDNKATARLLLTKVRAVIDSLISHVDASAADDTVFFYRYRSGSLPNLDVVRMCVKAFLTGEEQPPPD